MLKLSNENIYKNVDTCLNFLKTNYIKNPKTESENFHCYWYGIISDKQITSIKSFLVTQPNNYHINLWLDKEYGWNENKNNNLLTKLKKFITIKCYDYEIEKKNTEYEKYMFTISSKHKKLRSNKFRYLILHNYGGLYFDLDCIFLRSFEPLINMNIEFCYQWALCNYANNAIMRIKKNSKISKEIMRQTTEYLKIYKEEICITAHMSHFMFDMNKYKNFNFYILPSTFFDPIWILEQFQIKSKNTQIYKFNDFFKNNKKKITLNNFCEGAFTYHWHSRFKIKPEDKSPYEQLKKDINNKLLLLN